MMIDDIGYEIGYEIGPKCQRKNRDVVDRLV